MLLWKHNSYTGQVIQNIENNYLLCLPPGLPGFYTGGFLEKWVFNILCVDLLKKLFALIWRNQMASGLQGCLIKLETRIQGTCFVNQWRIVQWNDCSECWLLPCPTANKAFFIPVLIKYDAGAYNQIQLVSSVKSCVSLIQHKLLIVIWTLGPSSPQGSTNTELAQRALQGV